MKTLILALASLFVLQAQAAEPKISCELMYSKTNSAGIAVIFKRGQNLDVSTKSASTKNGTFTLTAQLTQICPADAGPELCTDDYTFTAIISKGNTKSSIIAPASSSMPAYRYSGSLDVGNESGFVNCDLVKD